MALCICGLKVDRVDINLQCIICMQIFHPQCCNVRHADLEFVKESYKCMKCLSRNRLSRSPSHANATLALNAENECPQSTLAGCSMELLQLVDVDSATNSTGDVLTELSADVIPGPDNSGNNSIAINCTNISAHSDSLPKSLSTEKITLDIVYAELVSLRKSNDNLCKLVSSLANDKAKLLTTVEELKLDLHNLQNSLTTKVISADRSPKRKKTANKINKISLDTLAQSIKTSTSSVPSANSPSINPSPAKIVSNTAASVVIDRLAGKSSFADILHGGASTDCMTNSNVPATSSSTSKINGANDAWSTVTSKKAKKLVTGSNDTDELEVFTKYKWVHLSSFKNSETTDNIIKYISKISNISANNFLCFKLIKRDADIDSLKFVNVKLGVTADYYKNMFEPKLWPENIKVRPFNFLLKENAPSRVQQAQKTTA